MIKPLATVHALALAACAATPGHAQGPLRYACADGTILTARFVNEPPGASHVVLRFERPRSRLSLPQAMSADGGRYADGRTEFWIKGRSATLTRPGRPQTTCSTQ